MLALFRKFDRRNRDPKGLSGKAKGLFAAVFHP
jgi:hypothetical protein